MMGSSCQPGLLPSLMNYIFKIGKRKIIDLNVKCSAYEIYNEMYFDFLNGHVQRKNIRNLVEVKLESISRFNQIFELVNKHRRIAETAKNRVSSRSHAVFKISSEGQSLKTNKNFNSSILMVDCAGQENAGDHFENASKGIRIQEMANINKSFSGLATAIECLKKRDSFVDFRSSKLTFVLRPYLTGQGRALFVVTASQEKKHLAASKAVFKIMDVINEINMMN